MFQDLSTRCAAFCTLQQPLSKGRTAHRLKKLEEGNVNQNINPIQTHSSCNPYHPSAIPLPPCNSHSIGAEETAQGYKELGEDCTTQAAIQNHVRTTHVVHNVYVKYTSYMAFQHMSVTTQGRHIIGSEGDKHVRQIKSSRTQTTPPSQQESGPHHLQSTILLQS